MSRAWRKGDKVRNKVTGKVEEVHAYKPTHSEIGSSYIASDKGFTFLDEHGNFTWKYIKNYELVEEDDKMSEQKTIKMTMPDGTIIEGTAEELTKLQQLSEGATEKAEESKPEEKVAGRVKVGHVIRITSPDFMDAGDNYDKGDIMVVQELDCVGDVAVTDKHRGQILRREYEIIGEESVAKDETEGRTYRKIDEDDANDGDFLAFTHDEILPSYLKNGKKYMIFEIDAWGDPHIIDEVGDEFDTCGRSYDVFEKTGIIEEGDTVRLSIEDGVVPRFGWGRVSNGSVGKVSRFLFGGKIEVDFPEQKSWGAVISELELVSKAGSESEAVDEEVTKVDVKEGGIYETTGEAKFKDIPVGTSVRVTDVELDRGRVRIEFMDGSDFDRIDPKYLENHRIKEGDIVRLDEGTGPFSKGTIGEITSDCTDGCPELTAYDRGDERTWYTDDAIMTLIARKEVRQDV